ncbi:MAG: flagellar biosynthesis anti-sigma factor FlgM [Bacilli bacterium]
MKINSYGMHTIAPNVRKQALQRAESKDQSFTDSLSISKNAQLRAEAPVQTERKERMQAIKFQVENGTYKPDMEQTAVHLLQFFEGKRP